MADMLPLFESIVSILLMFSFIFVLAIIYKLYDEEQKRSPTGRRLRKKIMTESPRIQKLIELNKKYTFHYIPSSVSFNKECSSKAEFERLSMDDVLMLIIKQNSEDFRRYNKLLEDNKRQYAKYYQEYSVIENEALNSNESETYKKMELLILESKKQTIASNYEIEITKRYRSPKGKNTYIDKEVYLSEIIHDLIQKASQIDLERERRRARSEHERALMTSSMRYDILKRDCFRCVICGASAEDGVKLQVDHIIPVSKGGKTTPSNLRTLCNRCNLGKKDKYDPYGIN